MMRKSLDHPIVAFSVRVYQVLLIAYPTQFRQEYGSHLIHVFRDSCLRVVRQGGTTGMLKLWVIALLDLVQSVLSEHSQKQTQMNIEMKPEDIRKAGWALILGAVSFTLSIFWAMLQTNDWSVFSNLLLMFVSLPLLVFGVLGLRNRYGKKVGRFGKNILLIGAIFAPLTSLVGFLLSIVHPFWFLIFAGPAVLFVCLTLFGIVALDTRPLPYWNLLPVIAGLSYPAIIFFYILTSSVAGEWLNNSGIPDLVNIIVILIQGIALLALGYILKADIPEETAVVA